jgi:hypothetical protein
METGWVFGLHAGRQDIKARDGGINPDFDDYRISLQLPSSARVDNNRVLVLLPARSLTDGNARYSYKL